MGFGNQGAHFGVRVGRIARRDAFCFGHERVAKRIIEAVFNQDARGTEADLALVSERRPDGGGDGLVEVAICEDDGGVLPAEFEAQLFEHTCSGAGDVRLFGSLL